MTEFLTITSPDAAPIYKQRLMSPLALLKFFPENAEPKRLDLYEAIDLLSPLYMAVFQLEPGEVPSFDSGGSRTAVEVKTLSVFRYADSPAESTVQLTLLEGLALKIGDDSAQPLSIQIRSFVAFRQEAPPSFPFGTRTLLHLTLDYALVPLTGQALADYEKWLAESLPEELILIDPND